MTRLSVINPLEPVLCCEDVFTYKKKQHPCTRKALYRIGGRPYCMVHSREVALNLLIRESVQP